MLQLDSAGHHTGPTQGAFAALLSCLHHPTSDHCVLCVHATQGEGLLFRQTQRVFRSCHGLGLGCAAYCLLACRPRLWPENWRSRRSSLWPLLDSRLHRLIGPHGMVATVQRSGAAIMAASTPTTEMGSVLHIIFTVHHQVTCRSGSRVSERLLNATWRNKSIWIGLECRI